MPVYLWKINKDRFDLRDKNVELVKYANSIFY